MAIELYKYITKDEYKEGGGTTLDENAGTQDELNADYNNLLEIASTGINWLSGNEIGDDLTKVKDYIDPITGKVVVKADLRIQYIKRATLVLASNLVDRGIKWLRGSSSITVGSNFSVNQTNPDEPDYVPPIVKQMLMNAHYFIYIVSESLTKENNTLPTYDPNTNIFTFKTGCLTLQEIKGFLFRLFGTMVLPGNNVEFITKDNEMTISINGKVGDAVFASGEKVKDTYINTIGDNSLLTRIKIKTEFIDPALVKIDKNITDINTLNGKVSTNEGEINTLKTNVDTNKSDITNLKNDKLDTDLSNSNIPTSENGKYLKVDNGN